MINNFVGLTSLPIIVHILSHICHFIFKFTLRRKERERENKIEIGQAEDNCWELHPGFSRETVSCCLLTESALYVVRKLESEEEPGAELGTLIRVVGVLRSILITMSPAHL